MRLLWVALVLVAVSAHAGKKKPPPKPPPPPPLLVEPSAKITEAIGEKTAGMLGAATKVVLYRVLTQQGVRPNPQLAVGVDFERQGTGRELTEGETKRFKNVLYDDKSFSLGKPPPCGDFKPDLAFLATSEADTGTLEILVSFKCGGLMYFTAKTAGRSLPGAQLDLKPARKALLTMVKELMPQDAQVQALK